MFGDFLNIPVVTLEFSGVVFIVVFVREGRAGGGGLAFFRTNLLLFD